LAVGIVIAAGIASPLVERAGTRKLLIAGLTLFAGGLVWLPNCPSTGPTSPTCSAPRLLIALGLGLTFVRITILSVTDVREREYGLVNTSGRIGAPLCLAVLSTIATTGTLVAVHRPIDQALTLGFHTASLGAAGFVVLAIIVAITIRLPRNQPDHTAAGAATA
jgi:MFS family permease